MIYIYRRAASDSARKLADLAGRRLQQNWKRLRTGDKVVCWGDYVETPPIGGLTFLNNTPIRSKFTDAETLKAAGIATVEVNRTQPTLPGRTIPAGPDPAVELYDRARDLAEDFASLGEFKRSPILQTGVEDLTKHFTLFLDAIKQPAPIEQILPGGPDPSWIGRESSHVGGADLLAGRGTDYFAKKEDLVNEYRVHSFGGKSIRAGKKIHRENFPNPHPWIRSFDAGWKISYDGDSIRQRHRDLAHEAVKALNLHFGAVDIGERADGSLIVLEVNRAPGIEAGTLEAYSKHITSWAVNG